MSSPVLALAPPAPPAPPSHSPLQSAYILELDPRPAWSSFDTRLSHHAPFPDVSCISVAPGESACLFARSSSLQASATLGVTSASASASLSSASSASTTPITSGNTSSSSSVWELSPDPDPAARAYPTSSAIQHLHRSNAVPTSSGADSHGGASKRPRLPKRSRPASPTSSGSSSLFNLKIPTPTFILQPHHAHRHDQPPPPLPNNLASSVASFRKNRSTMAAFPELIPFLSGNQEWVAETNAVDPAFLPTLAKAQAPPVLWIGCADSRVPESVVLKGKPGDVFVHRNIANQFQSDDSSANAVLAYGVLSLAAQHVVVVGHTNCGGCNAAFASAKPVPGDLPADHLSRFLHPLIELRHTLPSGSTAEDLVRANVAKSVENVVATETIKTAWAKGKKVHVHGWLYDLQTGLISDLGLTQGPQ